MSNAGPSDLSLELDAEGNSAGVEREDVGDQIVDPFDPRLIDVVTEVRSLDSLIRRIESGQIDLDPDFQRSRGIWTPKKKSLLIESLLLRIPLPTFYVAELDTGGLLGDNPWAVVDGIQRLSTIVEFVKPQALKLAPLRLDGLEYLHDEEGHTYAELAPSLQLRLLESQFTMQVIRRSTPEAVKLNIFARINTGGVPLSSQELRHALVPGPSRSFLKSMAASDAFQQAVAHSVSPTRMSDREMALRFIAFRLTDPSSYRETDLDGFLRNAMRSVNEWSDADRQAWMDDFQGAMRASTAVFADDAFRKRYSANDPRKPVSKALFEAVAVGFAQLRSDHGDSAITKAIARAPRIRSAFIKLMSDQSFDRAVSQGTGDPLKVQERFARIRRMFEEQIGVPS